MAITDESPVSASNLGAAVGLSDAAGGTGGKPVSAENLAALMEGGLVGLRTFWEGSSSDVTIDFDEACDLLVADVIYDTSGYGGPAYHLTVATSRSYNNQFGPAKYIPNVSDAGASIPTTFGNLNVVRQSDGRLRIYVNVDSYSPRISTRMTRIRGVSLAEALGSVVA